MNIKIVYWENNDFQVLDIDHTEWATLAPNNILKLFITKPGGGVFEIFGYGGYILHQVNGKYYFGGINTTQLKTLSNETLSIPVDNYVKSHPSLKLGIEIPDAKWKQLEGMIF